MTKKKLRRRGKKFNVIGQSNLIQKNKSVKMEVPEYECRGMRPADRSQVVAATVSAFGEARTQGYGNHFDSRLTKLDDLRVIVHHQVNGSKIVGCCPVCRYPMHFGSDITFLAGGIYMFGIAHSYKRKGLGQKLLEDCNRYLTNEGFDLNMLYTGSPSFYAHKGYELGIHKPRYFLSVNDLPSIKNHDINDSYFIRPFQKENLSALIHIYELFNQNIPLTRIRDTDYWTKIYSRHSESMDNNIFCIWHQERIVGYIWTRLQKQSLDVMEYAIDPFATFSKQQSIEQYILIFLMDLAKTKNITQIAINLFPRYSLVKYFIQLGAYNLTAEYSGWMVIILNLFNFLSKYIQYQKKYIIPNIPPEWLNNSLDVDIRISVENYCLHYQKDNIHLSVTLEPIEPKVPTIPISRPILGILTMGNWTPSLLVESEKWICPTEWLPFLDHLFPPLHGTLYPLDQF